MNAQPVVSALDLSDTRSAPPLEVAGWLLAGQMSLANVLAAAKSTTNIVLLGHPQQLDQPQRGVHPPSADASALSHLLNGRPTIAPERGLFLAESWRLHPDICEFTSDVFYEGRLVSRPENARQRLNVGET